MIDAADTQVEYLCGQNANSNLYRPRKFKENLENFLFTVMWSIFATQTKNQSQS